MFEWKQEYSVGYVPIDQQHKRLFELAEELHKAMIAGKAREVLGKTLSSLIAYTKGHFATEEALMRTHHYPEFAKHKAAHDALTAKVMGLEKEFSVGRQAIGVELLPFLRDWLTHHIGESDRKIAEYLKSKAA